MIPEITFNEKQVFNEKNSKIVTNNTVTAAHSSII
jgi:hypothetical protein